MEDHDLRFWESRTLEHAENPKNMGPLQDYTGHARITGPCGDTMEFWVLERNGRIEATSFITDGCGHSAACGSMATCLAQGKSTREASAVSRQDILDALGDLPEESEHCALLASNTLREALEDSAKRVRQQARNTAGAKSCSSCRDESCQASKRRSGESDEDFEERRKIAERLCRIRHKILVLSGKGGVGKSTVAVNLAVSLMLSGKRVGLMDVDIHGPSVPTMLGLTGEEVRVGNGEILPIEVGGLKVLSLGFFLPNQDDAVIWRGPMKMGAIKQFIRDAAWGDLDFLIVDSPPGTGDEPLSVCQVLESVDGAVIVTTPQKVAAVDVRKSISFCRQLGVPVIGVIENMSGFACPTCGEITPIFRSGGGRNMAIDMHVPFLGSIPIDPGIALACDEGRAFIHQYSATPSARIIKEIIRPIEAMDSLNAARTDNPEGDMGKTDEKKTMKEGSSMRIALPLADGKLCMHFGHCERFALVDVDEGAKAILHREDVTAPPHEPGLLPGWLAERGAGMIIAGGMGQRAQGLFAEKGIRVLTGAPGLEPEQIVNEYLAGSLKLGENTCDH